MTVKFDPTFGLLGFPVGPLSASSSSPIVEPWQRPGDWLAMPTVLETEQKVVGLFAVFDAPENFVALQFTGNYTVNWGDGNIENFNSGVKAQHSYSWSSISSGTITSEGHKQVLVTITPQAGQNLATMNLAARHDNVKVANDAQPDSPWLDLCISMPNANSGKSLVFNGSNSALDSIQRINILHSGGTTDMSYMIDGRSLRSFSILNGPAVTNMSGIVSFCDVLTSVSLLNISSATNMSNAFGFCSSLTSVSLLSVPSVINMSNMFQNCLALRSVSIQDASSATDMSLMFYNCPSLQSVSLTNTSSVTNTNSMFSYCSSLLSVSISDTSSVTDMSNMFNSCPSLNSVPLFNTSSVTNMSGMFQYCSSLKSVPLFNTSSVTNMNGMFLGCSALKSIPQFNTSSVTNISSMLTRTRISRLPLLNTSSVTNMSGMFYGCTSLASVPQLNVSSVTNSGNIFYNCPSLQAGALNGVSTNINYVNCLLSRNAIVDIFNNLATVVSKTINVSGNYGTASLTAGDIQIATSKGWTVVT